MRYILLLLNLAAPLAALADVRPDHYQGEPAETLEQAVSHFRDYNAHLAAILSQDELQSADLHRVHELTYTLENALEKLQEELADLAEVLEEVHVASETSEPEVVRSRGAVYLKNARQIVQ